MGDHRASIKIQFDFHGKTYEMDSWINYCDSDGNGVDSRVIEFFGEAYRDGMARYAEEEYEYHRERRKREEKEKELAELKRLKTKYEPTNDSTGEDRA